MRPSERWRWIVAADILIHLTAVWFFAFLPPSTLNSMEKIVMTLSIFAAVGVFTHVYPRLSLPLDHWSYLVAGFVCMFTLLIYEVRGAGIIPLSISIPFGLFLFAGAVSSFAAHVIDGGPTRKDRRGG